METTLEAEIDVDGQIRLLRPIKLRRRGRAIVQLEESNIVLDRPVSDEENRLAEERFASHFGAVKSGDHNSADNGKIDNDLMREYLDTHDDE